MNRNSRLIFISSHQRIDVQVLLLNLNVLYKNSEQICTLRLVCMNATVRGILQGFHIFLGFICRLSPENYIGMSWSLTFWRSTYEFVKTSVLHAWNLNYHHRIIHSILYSDS